MEDERVFCSFITKEAECRGVLARLAWAKVAKPLHFNADFEPFGARQKLNKARVSKDGDISEHRQSQRGEERACSLYPKVKVFSGQNREFSDHQCFSLKVTVK